MIIGIDARELSDRPAGKGQYLLRIVDQWKDAPSHSLLLYTKPGQTLPARLAGPALRQVEVAGRGMLWHRAVAKRLQADGAQAFFAALSYQSALWNKVPTVTVVHDLAVFRLPGLAHNRRAFFVERFTLKRAARRSASLIAVSESTKRDLIECVAAEAGKIAVIYEAPLLGAGERQPLPREKRQPFFLFTGTLEPRKNIGMLLQAYARLRPEVRSRFRLKLAGKPGWGSEDYRALARQAGIADSVDFLGYVSDADLAALFAEAYALAYPSLYEGFGLPVVEAMAAGTPVVTSAVSSLPEVVGDRGLTCDPHDPAAIAAALEKLADDLGTWEEQSRYLFQRSKAFSWEAAAAKTLSLLEAAA